MAAEVSLTATIHKTEKRVLWVETDKNFVDFLFGLFSIPMGHVFNFFNDNESVGNTNCLTNSYKSVDLMEKDFLLCDEDDILKPKVHLYDHGGPSLLKIENDSIFAPFATLDLFTCHYHSSSYFSKDKSICPKCKCTMNIPVKHHVPNGNPISVNGEGNGFVKGGGVKYVVTDDLSVSSKSSFSSLAYLNTMHIVNLKEVEEKVVNLNVEKCKKLLKLAFTANQMVLTNFVQRRSGILNILMHPSCSSAGFFDMFTTLKVIIVLRCVPWKS